VGSGREMRKRIPRLLAVLLVAAALAGGAYGTARHIGGETGAATDVMTVAPTAPPVSAVLVAQVTPTSQPPPTVDPIPAPIEEDADAPEDGDTAPPDPAPDVYSAPSEPEPQALPEPPVDPATLEAGVFAGINAQRAAAGLPSLQLGPDLVMVAGERSTDMAQRGYLSHVSPTGETFSSLMRSQGVACSWCGENIAYNNYTADRTVAVVLTSWMASPGHRDNILNPNFSRVGVGVALGGSGVKYYTAVFAGS